MKDAISLADSLHRNARARPSATALIAGDRAWTYAELLADLAQPNDGDNSPLIASGNSLELAQLAYRSSLQNRPFWPVDRLPQPTAGASIPPETALIISTSGSEGQPRAVLLCCDALAAAAAASNQRLPLNAGDIWLNCLPLYHIGGQSILWRCAWAGAGVLLHDGFVAEKVVADLKHYPISHISLVPAMLARLLDLATAPPASLRHVLVGGAALAPALYDRALAAGWPVYPSYGMSESAAQIATWTPADGPWQQGLVGLPLAGSEIAIGPGGRIRVRGKQLMLGYLNGGGLDADGWLTTGDLGQIDAAGCLTVTGRADDMLISAGRNVHPLDVEACLIACPGVHDVAVTGLPDTVWGDLVVALLVGPAAPHDILEHARQHLPSAALPRRLIFVDRLPRNPTGKLIRSELRRLAAEARS